MKMETISAEEEYARFVWYILNKIKKKLFLQADKNEALIYTLFLYPQTRDWDKPNATIEQGLLEKLMKLGVVGEANERTPFQIGKENETDNPDSAGINYYFKINEAIFNKQHNNYKKLVEQYNKADKQGNTLIFCDNGEITYISAEGKTYQTKLGVKTNNFYLLSFLVYNPHNVFSFKELAKNLKEARADVNFPDDESRVRNTIKSIKDKLKYHGGSLFESDYGFGLKCNVLIKK